jgi:hypothetical protein
MPARRWLLFLFLLGTFFLLGCGQNGSEDCTPNHHTVCKEDVVYWVDSCGERGDKAGDCECGCNADFTACKKPCECVSDCVNKECGDDGCGGTCLPGCSSGQTCVNGVCEGQCQTVCIGKCCGSDACGGTCPDDCAATGQTCNDATCRCEGQCTPNCNGKNCGSDGCGGDCGTCNPGYDCANGVCVCNYEVCGEVCCAAGETCQNDECCLFDCTGKQCGVNCAGDSCGLCAQGSFCSEYQCILAGVGDCWTGAQCPPEHPYCFMTCRSRENKCCVVMPDHPKKIDGSVDDSCEACCTDLEYPNPVLWSDGETSCCAAEAPYPFLACGSLDKVCCPMVAENPRRCDGTTDETCRVCCNGTASPIGVIFPDGHVSCCPEASPWPCVVDGTPGCCDQSGQCG